MTAPAPTADRRALAAHVVPFALFMAGLAVISMVATKTSPSLWLREPMYWVFPLQTVVCAAALVFFWRDYAFGPRRALLLAIGVGVLDLALWTCPQWLFHAPPRLEGFNPEVFANDPALYWASVTMRFLRLVIVVPLVEEIFWRGFLQRYLINERFTAVPFGQYSHLSFWAVTVAFTLIHSPADWPVAFVTGALFGWVAVRTKSLLACVVAHATTNLLLGVYIMATRQWGFW